MTDKDRMEQSGEIDEFWELDDASDTAAQKRFPPGCVG